MMAERGLSMAHYDHYALGAALRPGSHRSSPSLLLSGAKADGRFGKQDFIYQSETDTYRCPAGEQLIWRYTTVEKGLTLSRYWSSNCGVCAMKAMCTPSKQRRITRWEHEAVIEAMQRPGRDAQSHAGSGVASSSTSSARSRTGWRATTSEHEGWPKSQPR